MEKLHKEPGGYTKDSSSFTVELQRFHDTRGTPFRHAPRINGREVDLFALYNSVTSLGGWQKVNDHFKWDYVLEKLKFPKACANGSLALRQIYVRYLSSFEKLHYLGEDPDEDVDPTAEARSRKPNASLLCQVPLSYNKAQHELTEAQRASANMAPLAPPPSEYSKLCLSLLSSLPNEESLALNVCTLLSNEGRHVLRLDHCTRLVDLLLAQAGVFSLEDATLRPMYLECWQGVEGRRMERFWEDNLDSETITLFGLGTDHNDDDDELFNLNYQVGTRSIEGQRILRIALVFHNLSFEERNIPLLASNPSFVRFVMMCALSRWSSLRQVALDTIGNLAAKLVLDPVETEWSGPLIRIAREGILSRDRYLVVRCLDIVGQLSRGERNEEPLLAQMDTPLYGRIFELLTVHDLMLLVYALEALYLLSDLGPTACEHMLQVHQSVGILVSLLTLDPLAYGPTAQKGMRLIEVADPAVLRPAVPQEPPQLDPEAESFACTWVRAMYEPAQGCSVGRNDVYAEYVTFCSRAGRKNMVPASVFANCVKTVYSQTGIRRVDGPNGTVSLHHEGLRKRLAPLPVPIQVTSCLTISTQATPTRSPMAPAAANHSPILKAQLSAPLRALTPPSTPTGRPSPPSSPSPQGSSNLIKSLLANKVSRNLQRQQQLQHNAAEPDAATPVLASVAKPPEAANVQNCGAQPNRPKAVQPANNIAGGKAAAVVVGTRPNGIQRDLMVEGKPETTAGERLHNHVGENGGTTDVEQGVNAEDKGKVVYKSSPLLNGLLDKGKSPLQNGKTLDEDSDPVTNGSSVRVVASSDLSPISDIVGSVESASKAISRSNAEAVSCRENAAKRTAQVEEVSAKRPRLGSIEEAGVPQPNLVKLLSTDTACVKISNVPSVIVSSPPRTSSQVSPSRTVVVQASVPSSLSSAEATPPPPPLSTIPSHSVISTAQGTIVVSAPTIVPVSSVILTHRAPVSVSSSAATTEAPPTAAALENSPLVFTAPTSSTAAPAAATIVTTGVVTVCASTPSTTAVVGGLTTVATCKAPVVAPADPTATTASKGHHHHHHHHKPAKLMYHCEWKGCERTFTTPSAVLFHACKVHVPKSEGDFLCQWEGCDDMKRRRLSLFTHLQDRHCSEQVLQIQAVRRQQISQFGKASLPPPAQPPPHPGYAPDAAYLAIRRHALAYYNHRDAADEKESALAKSIRLTSALVLRNLATHSALARRRLRRYEQQLSAVAMSPLESSRTIAQCLREMSRAPN
uniref:Putative transcriptional regulator n=1 Tax=Ornithodoros turicata TaxID=34597 RepID=A0A2R5LNL9_9ACAR